MRQTIRYSYLLLCLMLYIPTLAQQVTVQQPIRNFEKLWNTFDARYANFELKKVDWQTIYNQYRPLVSDSTTNKQLFTICCAMLQELNDGHVTISANFEEGELSCGPPYDFQLATEFQTNEAWQQLETVIDQTLINYGFGTAVKYKLNTETNFQYRYADDLGYLRLDEMTEALTFGRYQRALDTAMKAFQGKRGLIIDLRFNGGGWDYNAYQLASRLISPGETLGHFERTRIKGKDAYTAKKYRTVSSKGKHPFTNKIVILTSDFTASATEVFLLLIKDQAHVTLIGDTTEGIFSDMYYFKLPNKWEVSLSHQQFFSPDGVNYEGIGITPTIQVVNTKSDLEQQVDAVLAEAIKYLR